jgi:hypothetical protein
MIENRNIISHVTGARIATPGLSAGKHKAVLTPAGQGQAQASVPLIRPCQMVRTYLVAPALSVSAAKTIFDLVSPKSISRIFEPVEENDVCLYF